MMMNRNELLELIPAYVLGSLDDDEHQMVETFIASDAEAQQLVQEYEAVTDILPLAAPLQSASSHLQADLRHRLSIRRQKPLQAEDVLQKPVHRFSYQIFLSSAAAIVLIFLGLIVFMNRTSAPDLPRGQMLYNEIISQANFQSFKVIPTEAENVTGELVVSEDGLQAVLLLAELPTIEDNQRYQLWMAQENHVESGGLFYWSTGHGPYYVVMPLESPIEAYIRFGMSIEPENGSPYPDAPSGSRLFSVIIS